MMGANDAQSLYENGQLLLVRDADLVAAYTARVALVMDEATGAGAHVMWVGLPPMGPGSTVPPAFRGRSTTSSPPRRSSYGAFSTSTRPRSSPSTVGFTWT